MLLGKGIFMFIALVTLRDGPLFQHYEVECLMGPVRTEHPVWLAEGDAARPWHSGRDLDFVRLCEWRLGVNVRELLEPDEMARPRSRRSPLLPRPFDAKTCNQVTHPDGWWYCPGAGNQSF